jgi:Haloacid Dehalogenase superfamily, subfamily IB, phosphoserine phosphatase-like
MVARFAGEGWEAINRQWETGSLSTEECAQLTLATMTVNPEQLDAFFENMKIDLTFMDFVKWARQQDYPIFILSDGYDNYIEKILTRFGLAIPYYANHLNYEEGWQMECLHLDKECQKCGVCKKDLMNDLNPPGCARVYIGDGYSDLCPAEYADIVFAKKSLAQLCRSRGINFYEYCDFNDIQAIIQKWA